MVENSPDEPTIPEQGLKRELVYAERISKFDV
jgi:hypothetical protein